MKSIAFEKTEQRALIETLDGHGLDTSSQDSGQHCLCGSDSRFEQTGGDLPWSSLDEHRAQVILASDWLREHDVTRLAAVEAERDSRKANAEVAVARMFVTEQREADLRTAIEDLLDESPCVACSRLSDHLCGDPVCAFKDDIRILLAHPASDPAAVGTHGRAMSIAQEWIRISQWREGLGLNDGVTGLYRQCAMELRAALGDPTAAHAAMLDQAKSEVLRQAAEALPTLRGLIRMAALVVMREVGEEDTALATAIASKASTNLAGWFKDRADEHSFNPSAVAAPDAATNALDAAPAQAKAEAAWITGPEHAAQFIAAVDWPWERTENRDQWAVKMLSDKDLFALESARSHGRLDAAIATVSAAHDEQATSPSD